MVCKSVTPSRVIDNFKIWDFMLDDGDMKVTWYKLYMKRIEKYQIELI